MKVTTSDGHTLIFLRDPEEHEYVLVSGDEEALEVFIDTVTLAGAAEVASGDETRSTGVEPLIISLEPLERNLRVHEGTLALFLQFELLNYS